MSKDIRSFFSVVPKRSSKSSPSLMKSILVSDSDDDEIVKSTPENKSKHQSKTILNKRKIHVISSDSEDEKVTKKSVKKLKQKEEKTLTPISVDEYYGNELVRIKRNDKRTKIKIKEQLEDNHNQRDKVHFQKTESGVHADKNFEETLHILDRDHSVSKKSNITELNIHCDTHFEKTLEDLDDNDIINNLDILDKTIEKATQKPDSRRKVEDTSKEHRLKNSMSQMNEINSNSNTILDQSAATQKKNIDHYGEGSSSKKPKLEHNDSGIDPDQERHEKMRYSAMLYQKYLHRGGPKHHGQKDLPKGNPDCLKNLTFLRTGVLDSMQGEEFENLVKEHGGRVVHAVSRKVNYVVVGEDPGPAKLDKAGRYNIPEIDEDQFLDLILTKSGEEPKFSKVNSVESCDSGISNPSFKYSPNETNINKEKKITVLKKRESDKNKALETNKIIMKSDEVEYGLNVEECSLKTGNVTSSKIQELCKDQGLSWADKYKPKNSKGILGQQDSSSNMNKLKKWLMNWYRNQRPEVRKKILKPSPWAHNDDGAYYKAALLSGPPGVGKTTTATLVSKELGFDVVEYNASDTRSKKLLHEEVAQLLSTTTIAGFASGDQTTTKKRVLLMDEVDGMAGNEDRGGIQELINLIKNTSVPIICMCNDRNHQKMRSLVNYCFDLRFNKPRIQQILSGMMTICFKEGLKISSDTLIEVINGTGCDIRQTLNHLTMWTSLEKNLTFEMASRESNSSRKDTIMGPWEVIRAVFSSEIQNRLADKFKLFYYDYSLGPLFVQQNYLGVSPKCSDKEKMKRVAAAAEAISMGDIIDSKIRGSNNWSLLETQALFSSVLPGDYMHGNITQRIHFPGWLGKNSSATKRKRMLGEIYTHTRTSTSGSKLAINLDYLLPLRNAIINPLKKMGSDGVQESIKVMRDYNLLREDLTNLIELSSWKDTRNPFSDIDAKVKSAFTRAYNKEGPVLPFAPVSGVSKKIRANLNSNLLEETEDCDTDTEVEEGIEADTMIKVKTKTRSKAKKGNTNPSLGGSKEGFRKTKDKSKGGNLRSKKGK